MRDRVGMTRMAAAAFGSGVCLLAGCGGAGKLGVVPSTSTAGVTSAPASAVVKGPRVVFVSWAQAAAGFGADGAIWKGLVAARDRGAIDPVLVEPGAGEDPAALLSRAARGASLVVLDGDHLVEGVAVAAMAFPTTRFVMVGGSVGSAAGVVPANVSAVTLATEEAGFAAGSLAGALEGASGQGMRGLNPKTQAVGAVGAFRTAQVERLFAGFVDGARRSAPGVRVFVDWSNSGIQEDTCREAAQGMIDQGVDVLLVAAGPCGVGAAAAARDAGVRVIAADVDAAQIPEVLVGSVVQALDRVVSGVVDSFVAGGLPQAGDAVVGQVGGAVAFGGFASDVPAAASAAAASASSAVAARTAAVLTAIPSDAGPPPVVDRTVNAAIDLSQGLPPKVPTVPAVGVASPALGSQP